MKRILLLTAIVCFLISASFAQSVDENGAPVNKLSFAEEQSGWKLLWDGKTNAGWHGARLDQFPKVGWSMENGNLTVLESGGGEAEHGGDIVTDKLYGAFELSVEFKITPGANSGIKYFVFAKTPNSKGSSLGLEFQVLDDEKHPDAKMGSVGNRTISSLYDLIPADGKNANPPGEWNHGRVVAHKNGDVEHWLNGKKVVEYNRFSQIFRALVQKSKYAKYENFGQIPEGHVLLQDHGNTVSYRNIKIREL
jgi:hypothetical protein